MSTSDPSRPPDERYGSNILIACGICVCVALALVSIRVYVRLKYTKNFGLDDWCIVVAMTAMFVEMMVIIPEVRLGAGRHVQYIEPKTNVARGLHLNFVTQPLCLIALLLTKLSVGLFLLRLTPSKRHSRLIWAIIVLTMLSFVGNFLTVFLQCRPLRLVWDGKMDGYCLPAARLKFAAYFNSSVSVLTDLLFALLPAPFFWRVQMNTRTKVVIIAILSLGIFAMVSGIIKITYLGSYGKHGDFLYDSSSITIWTTVEICTAIVAASAPCLKPLFRNLLQSSLLSKSSGVEGGVGFKTYSKRTAASEAGWELQDRGRVGLSGLYNGHRGRKTESEEHIVRPEDGSILKSMSVSVT